MHPNPVFRTQDASINLPFVRARGFGVLSISADPIPLFAHIPFLMREDGAELDLHLVRSNPIARAVAKDHAAVIVVSGPDSYISPDWYGLQDQVPTWNYAAVHVHGRLERRPQEELRDLLDRLSAHFEAQLAPKPAWTADKMQEQVLDKMMRMIVPYRFIIQGTDGTWKLGQNKPDDARTGAANAVETDGIGHHVADLARLMRDPPKS